MKVINGIIWTGLKGINSMYRSELSSSDLIIFERASHFLKFETKVMQLEK